MWSCDAGKFRDDIFIITLLLKIDIGVWNWIVFSLYFMLMLLLTTWSKFTLGFSLCFIELRV